MRKFLTNEEFIQLSRSIHGDRFGYEKTNFINYHIKITIECKLHGYVEVSPTAHIKGNGCNKCGKERGSKLKIRTKEYFLNKIEEKFGNKFSFSKMIYTHGAEPIIVICSIHGKFQTTPNLLLASKYGCSDCACETFGLNRRTSKEDFLITANKNHINYYGYSLVNFETLVDKIKIICPTHGVFEQVAGTHMSGSGCFNCAASKRGKLKRLDTEKFIQISKEKHGDVYDYSEVVYINNSTKVKIFCKVHKMFFMQMPQSHMAGKRCKSCGLESRVNLSKTKQEDFIKQAEKIHGKLYNYDKVVYVSGRTKIIIYCSIHGDFYQTPDGHLSGRGCKLCIHTVSKGETEWLDFLKIPNNSKHRNVIIDIPGRYFKVDGFDPENKIVYEYLGDYFHGHLRFPRNEINLKNKKSFKTLYDETFERKKIIEQHGFTYTFIWESDWKIIKKEMKKLSL